MNTSNYQSLKLHIVDTLGLSKDAIHIHIGLVVFIATVFLWKKGKISLVCIAPVLLLAFGMEFIDLYDDYNSFGYFRWSNSLHDIINTSFWPALIVILFRNKKHKPQD